MATAKIDIADQVGGAHPRVRRIEPADLRQALAQGFDDFIAMPTFSLFLVAVYPIIGLILFWLTFGLDMMQLIFPLVVGFSFIGPLAAVGLYELSRRRERGLGLSLDALKDIHLPCLRAIAVLGVVLLGIFFSWMGAAVAIYGMTFGTWEPRSVAEFLVTVFTTPAGWALIVAGCGIGLLFAILAFTISVVSIPMLVDRNVSLPTAVETSVRAVIENPKTMALWGAIVAAGLALGAVPFLIGLAVVFPLLGHSTWHLYRAVVEA